MAIQPNSPRKLAAWEKCRVNTFAFAHGVSPQTVWEWVDKGLVVGSRDSYGAAVLDVAESQRRLVAAKLIDMNAEPHAARPEAPAEDAEAAADRRARLLDLNLAVLAARRKLDQVRANSDASIAELREAFDAFAEAEDALAAEYRQR